MGNVQFYRISIVKLFESKYYLDILELLWYLLPTFMIKSLSEKLQFYHYYCSLIWKTELEVNQTFRRLKKWNHQKNRGAFVSLWNKKRFPEYLLCAWMYTNMRKFYCFSPFFRKKVFVSGSAINFVFRRFQMTQK